MKYDVFISYSRKDYHIVTRICEELTKNGISFFVDKSFIKIGNDFPEVIADAILNSRLFLFVASENSYSSNFTNSEIAFAHKHKSKDCIIPYIIDGSTLPIGLDLVLSSIDYKTTDQYPIDALCRELSLRINTQRTIVVPKVNVKLLAKCGCWLVFAVLSFLICLGCVNSLELLVPINAALLWCMVSGWWGLVFVSLKIVIRESLVKNDIANFSLGVFSAFVFGVLVIAPCLTHYMYLQFRLKSDVKSEISTLYDYANSITDNNELKSELEAINNRITNAELDVFDGKDALVVKSVIEDSYHCLKEYYTTNDTSVASKQYFANEHSNVRSIYSVIEIWKLQFRDGFKIEFVISLVVSIIVATFTLLILKKL